MDEPTRITWSKPELIVLVRSGPEEAVLESCKLHTSAGLGHAFLFPDCHWALCESHCSTHVSS